MPANNPINIGVIGMGYQGPGNTQGPSGAGSSSGGRSLHVDRKHPQAAAKMVNDA